MPLKKPDPHRVRRLNELCEALGYQFEDLGLLNLALCHSSLGNEGLPNYERLEFLGDAVLGFLVAESLYQRKPEIPEGELTARRSLVVSRAPLSKVALGLKLNEYILVGRGLSDEALKSRRILADLTEAVLGAIYLDGGIDAARRFVQVFLLDRFAVTQERRVITDPKTRLNQWAQSNGLGAPEYAIIQTTGPDHDPTFRVSVTLDGRFEGSHEVKSKQAGEQQAASQLLARLVEEERAAKEAARSDSQAGPVVPAEPAAPDAPAEPVAPDAPEAPATGGKDRLPPPGDDVEIVW